MIQDYGLSGGESIHGTQKGTLTNTPLLIHSDFKYSYHLDADGSFNGIGEVLYEIISRHRRVIAYASRTLSTSEKGFAVRIELNFFRFVWLMIEKFLSCCLFIKVFMDTDSRNLLVWQTIKFGAIEQR